MIDTAELIMAEQGRLAEDLLQLESEVSLEEATLMATFSQNVATTVQMANSAIGQASSTNPVDDNEDDLEDKDYATPGKSIKDVSTPELAVDESTL